MKRRRGDSAPLDCGGSGTAFNSPTPSASTPLNLEAEQAENAPTESAEQSGDRVAAVQNPETSTPLRLPTSLPSPGSAGPAASSSRGLQDKGENAPTESAEKSGDRVAAVQKPDNFWHDLMRELAEEKRQAPTARKSIRDCDCPDPLTCPDRHLCTTLKGPEDPKEEEDFQIPDWARKMSGPWGHRRRFTYQHRSERYPFADAFATAAPAPQMEWLVEGFLPKRYLTVLGGDSKCGKSWFVTALAMSVATGTPFLGRNTPQRNVAWVSFEENDLERQLAFDAWFAAGGPRPDPFTFMISYEKLFIDEPFAMRWIYEVVKGNQCGLLVIDPLHAAYSTGSIVESTTARRVLAGVKQLTQECDVTVLVIHHLTKQTNLGLTRERMSDSAQILAAASMDWLMEVKEDRSPSLVTVSRDEGGAGGGRFGVEDGEDSLPCEAGEGGGGGANQVRPSQVDTSTGNCVAGEGQAADPADRREGNEVGSGGAHKIRPSQVDNSLTSSELDPRPSALDPQSAPTPNAITPNARLIRLLGRGRGHEVNRDWLIESPTPMAYRLAEENPDLLRTPSERAILAALKAGRKTARQIAEATRIPANTVRNILARLVKAEEVLAVGTINRERIYGLEKAFTPVGAFPPPSHDYGRCHPLTDDTMVESKNPHVQDADMSQV